MIAPSGLELFFITEYKETAHLNPFDKLQTPQFEKEKQNQEVFGSVGFFCSSGFMAGNNKTSCNK